MDIFNQKSIVEPGDKFLDDIFESIGQAQSAEIMKASQRQAESGGRQFDASGKPLEGRRANGARLPVNERAYGISQMQIRTGKNVAAAHGIQWDEKQFLNDAAYNGKLGDLHMSDLRTRYGGDEALAIAAYHSGERNVNNAVSKHGRANFTQGLGPEGRAYVRKLTGEGSGGVAGSTGAAERIPTSINLEPPPATQAELDRMGKPHEFEVANPFKMGPELKQAVDSSKVAADFLTQVTNQMAVVAGENQDTRVTNTADAVADRGAVIDAAIAQDRQHNTQLSEVLTRRRLLASQRAELRTMNPFQRFFKSLTDANYSDEHLRKEEINNETQLQILKEEDALLSAADQQILTHFDQRLSNNNATSEVLDQGAETGYRWATRKTAAATNQLGELTGAMRTQNQVDQMQENAKTQVLSQISESALSVAEEAATANGGVTIVNGIEVSAPEINKFRLSLRHSRLSAAAGDLAVEKGNLELEDFHKTQAVMALTPQQRQEAMRNGGSFGGVQYDVAKLSAAVEADGKNAATVLDAKLTPDKFEAYQGQVGGLADQIKIDVERVTGLTGGTTDEMTAYVAAAGALSTNHAKILREATASGTQAHVIDGLIQQMATLQASREKAITNVATSWAGSNKSMIPIAKSYLSGGNVSSQDAAQVLVLQARGKLSRGLDSSPDNATQFNFIRDTVNKWDVEHKDSKDEAGLVAHLTRQLQTRREGWIVNQANQILPEIAKGLGHPDTVNGEPHPFGRIDTRDWAAAVRAADQLGLKNFISHAKLGLETSDPNAALEAARKLGIQNPERMLVAAQLAAQFEVADQTFSTVGFDASKALADLISRPGANAKLTEFANGQIGNAKFGDFLLNGAQGRSGANRVSTHFAQLREAYTAWKAERINNSFERMANTTRPFAMVRAVLKGIEGVTPAEADMLADSLKNDPKMTDATGGHGDSQARQRSFDLATSFILNSKLADPNLESIRRRAASGWQEAANYYKRFNEGQR